MIREGHIDVGDMFFFCFNFSAVPKSTSGVLVPRPGVELTLQWKHSLNH